MKQPKYIVVEEDGEPYPIIFPEHIAHSEIGGLFRRVVSAGFVLLGETEATAFGRSASLGVGSRSGDSQLLSRALGYGEN